MVRLSGPPAKGRAGGVPMLADVDTLVRLETIDDAGPSNRLARLLDMVELEGDFGDVTISAPALE